MSPLLAGRAAEKQPSEPPAAPASPPRGHPLQPSTSLPVCAPLLGSCTGSHRAPGSLPSLRLPRCLGIESCKAAQLSPSQGGVSGVCWKVQGDLGHLPSQGTMLRPLGEGQRLLSKVDEGSPCPEVFCLVRLEQEAGSLPWLWVRNWALEHGSLQQGPSRDQHLPDAVYSADQEFSPLHQYRDRRKTSV